MFKSFLVTVATLMFISTGVVAYLIHSANIMSTLDKVTCISGLNHSMACTTALILEDVNH